MGPARGMAGVGPKYYNYVYYRHVYYRHCQQNFNVTVGNCVDEFIYTSNHIYTYADHMTEAD